MGGVFFFPEAAQEPLSPEKSSQLLKSLLCHDLRDTFSLSPCKSKPMPLPFTCGFPQSSRASVITPLFPHFLLSVLVVSLLGICPVDRYEMTSVIN